jgi:hypothetical protein
MRHRIITHKNGFRHIVSEAVFMFVGKEKEAVPARGILNYRYPLKVSFMSRVHPRAITDETNSTSSMVVYPSRA